MDMNFANFQMLLNSGVKQEDGVFARFYDRAVKTKEVTENGLPIFKNVTFVEIRIKDQFDVFDQPADDTYYKRFPIDYARYQLEKKAQTEGTPLKQFAFLDAAQLETCTFRGVFTVEQLAGLSDEKATELHLETEKDLANKFLDVQKDNKKINDFAQKEKKYKEEIARLKETIAEMKAGKDE